ncbi:MAG: hypothetical protein DLM71_09685 [Chloroflexi bacterium]|nr:MAG: hypothetical protein DLM71_09685 [Chloroflexota bacterium]
MRAPSRTDLELIGLTLLIKPVLLLLGVAAAAVIANSAITAPGDMVALWNRWDAPHYLDLVVFGYRAADPGMLVGPDGYRSVYPGDLPLYIVFFPLFPWLATPIFAVLRDPLTSVLIVSTVASLFVAPLLYHLVAAEFGMRTARYAAWFVLIFPTAYFLHIGYTEGLFLALVLGSFLAARRDRWWLAGILGGLAALARINGLVLIPALIAEAGDQWYRDPARRLHAKWLAIGLVGVGFAGYLALNLAIYGNPLAFLRIQNEHWFKSLAWPWEGIGGVVGSITGRTPSDSLMLGWMELLFIGLGLAGTVYAAFRFRPSWFVWMTGNWLLFTSTAFVMSVPRYSLTLFPLFVWFAVLARRPVVLAGLSIASLLLFGFFATQFAAGRWAF